MALVSGRPISFKMDLYNPLYVSRPTVEPELFASLRPPTYTGAMKRESGGRGVDELKEIESRMGNVSQSFGMALDSGIMGGSGKGVIDEKKLRQYAARWGRLSEAERGQAIVDLSRNLPDG